ncbi:hypothetical protein [Pseudoduganella sp. UC29_71]|uniref:hypothetical protein n=1 Tax=Pseudoduganella sp. UC29_71 TaxID=3350174 RepID=UPI00366FEFB3
MKANIFSSVLSPEFAFRAAKSAARRNPLEPREGIEYSAVIGTPNTTDHQPEGRAK